MRHRILYIEKPSDVGGSVIGLYETVRSLDRRRYEPVVLFHGPNPYRDRFRALGVNVLTLSEEVPAAPMKASRRDIAAALGRYSAGLADAYRAAKEAYLTVRRDWPQARRLARVMKEQAVDLAHHNNSLGGNRDSVIAAQLAGVRQVCHVRNLERFSYIDAYLARHVDAFIYMSTAIEGLYRELGIAPEEGHVVYDPFDADAFGRVDRSTELRAELGLAERDWVISNVGRLDWWKGQDVFLQALAELVPVHPKVKALLIGGADGSGVSQRYEQRLRDMVTELRLSDCALFTGFRTDAADLMGMSDVVVHSSSEPEPFGRVVVEAMLAGRPVVATGAGGVLDIIEDQVTGLLVPPKDTGAMAEALQQLLHDPEGARRMGERAQQAARERFSTGRHAAQVQRIYEEILTAQRPVREGMESDG
jgi:hypothetical protein